LSFERPHPAFGATFSGRHDQDRKFVVLNVRGKDKSG
jgi:hypothetical protein